MAQIREELQLIDRFSAQFTRYITLAQQSAQSSSMMQASLNNIETSTAATAQNIDRLANEIHDLAGGMGQAQMQGTSLCDTIKKVGAAIGGLQTAKWLVNTSDSLTSTTARIDMMNDGLQTTEELNEMVYQSAQRSRGAYADTAAFVSQLGNLAGDAFDNSAEIVAFAEQINKQMALSGTTTQAAQGAMLQLTQGLSSGALRGEELNSILEQTPMIAQSIANYMGVTTGEMRELASEGKVTAEVVKNAMFAAAEDTVDEFGNTVEGVNSKFEDMPMTWEQIWTQMQNVATKALQPILDGVNWLANNVDTAVQWISDNFDSIIPILAGLGAVAIWAGAMMVKSAILSAASWIATNWPILLVVAAIALIIYMARQMGATWEQIGGVVGGVFMTLYAFVMNNFIIPLQNMFAAFANFFANLFNDPVTAIKVLFFDMGVSILGHIRSIAEGIESLINAIPGVEINITSGIDNMYDKIKAASEQAKSEGEWKEYVKAWDYIDYTDAWNQGVEVGSSIGAALDNFNLNDALGGLLGGDGSGIRMESQSYDEIASDTDEISKNTKDIKKSVAMSEEDIKSLVDVAERRYVNNINLTAQTPVITVNGANTGNTAADRQSLANAIRDILIEQAASSSFKSTARVF